MPRRENWSIIGAILEAIAEQVAQAGDNARLTNVATRANVAYDRLQKYMQELQERGMVAPGPLPRLTEKGYEFLRMYKMWREILGRFGIERDPPELP